jgi:hypothetical protein
MYSKNIIVWPVRQPILWRNLASGDLGTGDGVAGEAAVDVGGHARVGGLDVSGDLGGGTLETGATASDLDLTARDYSGLALSFMYV